jgi:hypothetical protein
MRDCLLIEHKLSKVLKCDLAVALEVCALEERAHIGSGNLLAEHRQEMREITCWNETFVFCSS